MWTPQQTAEPQKSSSGLNLGGAIGGLAGLASTLVGNWMNNRNVTKQNRENRELAEYSYSKDLEMWNRQNEYNLPASQMARLREAGLNPNLVYGSGGAKTEGATMPRYNAPTMDYNYKPIVDPLTTLGAFQDFQIKQAQTNNLKAQNEILNEEAGIKALTRAFLEETLPYRTKGTDLETRIKAIEAGWRTNNFEDNVGGPTPYQAYQLESLKQGVEMKKAGISSLGASTYLKQRMGEMYDLNAWARILSSLGIRIPGLGNLGGKSYTRSAGKGAKQTMSARPSRGSSRVIKNGNVTTTTWQKD